MATQKMGRYEITRELGHGGMGTVFLARDPAFDRHVAVKVLPAQLMRDPQFLARFQREAKIIAALEHACIVPVYDYGEDNGQPYIVMRYMSGGTLGERLDQGPMSLREMEPIVQRLADALDEAHQHNIVHRDLKPGNIMFDNKGQAFLSDFGIAKLLETNSALTGTGMVGTPAYMSPEQAAGHAAVDRRSDVYSLGLIVYEMLSGRHPYGADTPMSMMYKQIHEMPPPLDTAALKLPTVTRAVVTRALAKKPEERYPTAGEFARYLSGLHSAPLAVAPSKPVPLPPPPAPTMPVEITSAKEKPPPALPTRAVRRWSPWIFGLVSVPIITGVICVVVIVTLNPIGSRATPTRMLPSTLTSAPPTHTPTSPKPTATPTSTSTVTFTPTSTFTPSATLTTVTRIPSTNTSAPLPSNTFVPPPTNTFVPPTEVPPTATPLPPPTTPPTNTPVPEPLTNTPAP